MLKSAAMSGVETISIGSPADLPSVDRLLQDARLADLADRLGRSCVVNGVRAVLDEGRADLAAGRKLDVAGIPDRVVAHIASMAEFSLRPVLNLTGTVIHTNLGRSSLSEAAINAMTLAAREPVNLEYSLEAGKRGDRDSHLERRICSLTGAEAATVVNNNAAAVLLVLNTLANRRNVPVSRGELVEIGDGFRLPDIMRRAGARLVEVGTTNRTHLADFEAVMSERPAVILKVHTSNYAVVGFAKAVDEQELAALCRRHDVPFFIDLGSGTVVDLEQFGLPQEPTVQEALAHGADLVTFSGDKLLGGPQAGVIAGRPDLIARIRKNPMRRALRLDKTTIAALDATLALYQHPEKLAETVPSLRLLARSLKNIRWTAESVEQAFPGAPQDEWRVDVADCFSQIGSGALPTESLPSVAVRLMPIGPKKGMGRRLSDIAASFRNLPVPVVGRIEKRAFWLDMRTLEEPDQLVEQLDAFCWPGPP